MFNFFSGTFIFQADIPKLSKCSAFCTLHDLDVDTSSIYTKTGVYGNFDIVK